MDAPAGGQQIIYVSDAVAWQECERKAWFALHPPDGIPVEPDRFAELVKERGDEHERRALEALGDYVQARSAAHTRQLIAERVPVIYQPRFEDQAQGIVGIPDFLILTDDGYVVGDAKLSLRVGERSDRKGIRAQLATYRTLAHTRLPGRVYLGNGDVEEMTGEADADGQQFITDMITLRDLEEEPDTQYSSSKCSACEYAQHCLPRFRRIEEPTLNHKIEKRARNHLIERGFDTLTKISQQTPTTLPDVPYLNGAERKRAAILQARSLLHGEVHRLRGATLPAGTYVHFDIESDPLASLGIAETYLWGFLLPGYSAHDFEYVWRDAGETDEACWKTVLELLSGYRDRYPDIRLVHYSSYERTEIKKNAKRYDDEDHPTVVWLLDEHGPLFDLLEFIRQNLILPVRSYSLKAICKHPDLVNFQWDLEESGSQ
mgnify:CR=1 FL=1